MRRNDPLTVNTALIAGAGPSGAIAALLLARAGVAVTLVERSAWPRPKTCGDGVSPHAIAAGTSLGLTIEGDVRLDRALITTPRDTGFIGAWPATLPWGTTIERHAFDALLVDAAREAGARFLPQTTVARVKMRRDHVTASLRGIEAETQARFDCIVVAEGATGRLAGDLGFPRFRSRSIAVRGYADAPHDLATMYGLFYDRMLAPGYGWVFPMNVRRANVGICLDERRLARLGGNARAVLDRWLRESPRAKALLGEDPQLHDVRGGIIPSGRRRRTNGRAFLIGDAAGVADPFTAEGIFQAMRSGALAAEALAHERSLPAARRRYERDLREFDRNEGAARGLRATFVRAIEPIARRAAHDPAFASFLATAVFLPKRGFLAFVAGLFRRF